MAIDREATLKQAEKLLRQGKLDAAIQEYVRLVDDQPRDWNAINALGDLYVRAGDGDRAIAQFTRIADYLYGEGFFPKAAALYKKALKVRSDHEHTLLRLADIAAQQGILADARTYLRQLAQQRRERGDRRGTAECLVRIGTLDDADGDAKVAAAQATHALGEAMQAFTLFLDAAEVFDKQSRPDQALEALIEAARLNPADEDTRSRIVQRCVAAGELERAAEFVTAESASGNPDLLVALAQMEFARGNDADGRGLLMRVLTLAPERSADVVAVADAFVVRGERERAYGCIEVAADAALFESDFERAAVVLETFVASGAHVPALMKLVEVCVDAGFDERLRAAQAQLADAYLDAGRAAEARVIAEDLLAHDTASDVNRQRLLRALLALGIDHPEDELARVAEPNEFLGEPLDLSLGEPPDLSIGEPADLDLPEPAAIPEPVSAEPPAEPAFARVATTEVANEDTIVLDALEVDLSETLATLGAASPVLPPAPSSPAEEPVQPPPDLESVFETMRARAANQPRAASASAPDEVYARAQEHLHAGRWTEAMNDLETAVRTPALRFMAASQLGRLFIARGEFGPGTEWLERAAEAPAPTAADATAVLYDLASALEKMGESARALAIFMEILVDSGSYRDVSERVDRLARVQAESHGA